MRLILFAVLLLSMGLSIGCCRQPIAVDLEYLTPESLASYQVDSPDPSRFHPTLGQKLHINWNLSRRTPLPLQLKLTLRFRNHTEHQVNVTVYQYRGCYTYDLLNQDYFDKKGILTYKIELFAGEELVHQWIHQVWVERIIFEAPEEKTGQ